MAFSIEIVEFEDLGRLPGARAQAPVLPPVKAKRYAAAALSDALSITATVFTIRNLGDVAIWLRVNAGADVTQAATGDSKSIALLASDALTFLLPDDVVTSNYKIDMRAQA